jgi:hypothetical protein
MLAQGLNTRDSTSKERANAKVWLQRKEELWQERSGAESEMRQAAEYCCPRRDFEIRSESKGRTMKRRLVDSTASIAIDRASSTIYGYLMSPTTPWCRPELLERDFTYAEDAWADDTAVKMHRYMTGSATNFRTQLAEDVDDAVGLGNSMMWQQPKRGRGSSYLSVPMKSCAWSVNEEGAIEENHRLFSMSLRRALLRYPASEKLRELGRKTERPESVPVQLLHVVEPRPGGVRGDLREVKPWRDIVIYIDGCEVVEIGGHDRKPLIAGRFKGRSGDAYGEGLAWRILPLAKLANAILEAIVRNAELISNPPMLSLLPQGTALDLRPGATNRLNTLLAQTLRDPKDVLQRINVGGDVNVGFELLSMIWRKIDQGAFIDWMTPSEGPQKTATEVWDLRDMRLRTMGPIIARLENEKMGSLAENTFEDMMASGMLTPPPQSLDRELIGFSYLGPLALAQRQGEIEGFQRFLALAQAFAQLDPTAPRMLKADPSLRAIANAFGVQGKFLASPDEMDAFRQGQVEAGEIQENMAAAEAAARTVQAGGQGLMNLSKVVQPGGTP